MPYATWPRISISFQLRSEESPLRQLAYPQNLVNRVSAWQPRGRVRRRMVCLGPRRHPLLSQTRTSTRASFYASRRQCVTERKCFFVEWNVNSDGKCACIHTHTYTLLKGMNFSDNTRHCAIRAFFLHDSAYLTFLQAHETECLEFSPLDGVNNARARAFHFFANEKLGWFMETRKSTWLPTP